MSTYRFIVQGDTIPAIEATIQEEITKAYPDGHPGLGVEMDVRPAEQYRAAGGERTIDRALVADVVVTIRDLWRYT